MSASSDPRMFPELDAVFEEIFGNGSGPIEVVYDRALRLLPSWDVIVWEGDPATFEFTYVSPSAERILGHGAMDWLKSGFWADSVLHPDDRKEAIAFCALATGQCRDHEFEYRARSADGSMRWLYDVVKVVRGPMGLPSRLRGLMVDVTRRKELAGENTAAAVRRYPVLT